MLYQLLTAYILLHYNYNTFGLSVIIFWRIFWESVLISQLYIFVHIRQYILKMFRDMRLSDERFSQVFDSVERLNTPQAIKKCYDHSQLAKIAGILLGLACLVVSAVFSFSCGSHGSRKVMSVIYRNLSRVSQVFYGSTLVGYIVSLRTSNGQFVHL